MKCVSMFLFVFLCLGIISSNGFADGVDRNIDTKSINVMATIAAGKSAIIPRKMAKAEEKDTPKKVSFKKKTEAKKKAITKKEDTTENRVEIETESETEPETEQSLDYDVNANVSNAYHSALDFKREGEYHDESGYSYTWYSENVLPGGGLDIPGRHVNEEGYVCDENGNLCLASDNFSRGTVVKVPFSTGIAVVYDSGSGYGNLDVYVSW